LEPVSQQKGAGPNGANRVAVAFLTHLFDAEIETRYRKIKSDLSGMAQIFILAPLGTSIPSKYSCEAHFFNYDRLRSEANRVIGNNLLPGNVHLAALDFFLRHGDFEYYWFVEYDVAFSGNWATLFAAVLDDPADLLAAHIRSLAEEPRWPWWSTLHFPDRALPQTLWLRAFFPVYRISRGGLRAVSERVKLGWSGHFEALIPCAIASASLSISELGGSGTLTPAERRHQFYSSFSSNAGESLNAGTLRHRPAHIIPPLRSNTIYHPIKARSGDGLLNFLRQQHLRELPMRIGISLFYFSLALRVNYPWR
jgi:hypothetical protein